MASKMLNEAARASAAGEIDFDADTYYARLLLTNTTVDTEQAGITTVAGYTTLDEHGTAGTKPLANKAVNKDDPNLRVEIDADDLTWTALAADVSGRDIQGVLICRQAGGAPATSDLPVCWLEYATPKTPDGSDFVVKFDAEGFLQLRVSA